MTSPEQKAAPMHGLADWLRSMDDPSVPDPQLRRWADAIESLEAALAVPAQWMPIETAPKDERILLFVPAFGPWNASWWPGSWAWTREQWAIHTPFSGSGDRAIFGTDIPQPTGWMPLPAPPGAAVPEAEPTLIGNAKEAFDRLRIEIQPPEWTVGEAATYYGFFLHGWQARKLLQPAPSASGDALNARRYEWLRAGNYPLAFARSVLNDTPHGIDAAIDAQITKEKTK